MEGARIVLGLAVAKSAKVGTSIASQTRQSAHFNLLFR